MVRLKEKNSCDLGKSRHVPTAQSPEKLGMEQGGIKDRGERKSERLKKEK